MREGIQGKVVLLTGGCFGLGAEIARHLAFRGARVAVAGRRKERLDDLAARIVDDGGEARAYRVDVARGAQVRAVVDATIADFGRLNVIVNNAAVMMPNQRMLEARTDAWDATIDVNLKGMLHGVAAALPVFQAQGHGHIINLSAVAATKVCAPRDTVCAGVKLAVRAITDGLRQEVAGRIRVTCILSGAIEGEPMFGEVRARLEASLRRKVVPASSVARAIAYAIEQPTDIDINEIVLRAAAGPRRVCPAHAVSQLGEPSWAMT